MPEKNPLRVGDRVTVDGRDDVFFVLSVDLEKDSVSLLPRDNSPILNEISANALALLPKPGPNGATA
jgi:hypothetical protein